MDSTANPSVKPEGTTESNGSPNFETIQALKHNPGVSTEWSAEEQSILEDRLNKYKSLSNVVRYAKIAMDLHDKTVRDVALRCRWMSKKEIGKRRKDDPNTIRKSKDKKEKVGYNSTKPSTQLATRPNAPPYALPPLPLENDDGISYKEIGGTAAQLFEQNAQTFNQIYNNLMARQTHENINLFCQARENIHKILNELNDMMGVMKQMPPLPAKMNEELVNSILPRTSMPMKSS